MRLTHVEVSVSRDTLTDAFAADLDRLTDLFGWSGTTHVVQHPTAGPSTERAYTITPDLSLYVLDGQPWSADLGDRVMSTFFVRLLLPIWFQFEATEPKAGSTT